MKLRALPCALTNLRKRERWELLNVRQETERELSLNATGDKWIQRKS